MSWPMASDNLPMSEEQAEDEELLRELGIDLVEVGMAPPPMEDQDEDGCECRNHRGG